MSLNPFSNKVEPLSSLVRRAAPRQIADKVIVVGRSGDGFSINVWLKIGVDEHLVLIPKLVVFDYSEDFPTELDIARLCVECP